MVVWLQVELSDGTAHTITDAYAGKEYIIQVAAKDNEIGTWSKEPSAVMKMFCTGGYSTWAPPAIRAATMWLVQLRS